MQAICHQCCSFEEHLGKLYKFTPGKILYIWDALHKAGLVDKHMNDQDALKWLQDLVLVAHRFSTLSTGVQITRSSVRQQQPGNCPCQTWSTSVTLGLLILKERSSRISITSLLPSSLVWKIRLRREGEQVWIGSCQHTGQEQG